MKLGTKRCDNGHLYNISKYSICPYCDEKSLENTSGNITKNKKSMTISNTGDDDKTQAYWDGHEGEDPVVGWIVCIEGVNRGKDYKVRSERNFIGRSEDMHINIQGDNTISRRNHAAISYNPKQRNFVLLPGDGTGIIYVNDEALYSPLEINAYDIIEMGKNKFLFIPLCGGHFEWDSE